MMKYLVIDGKIVFIVFTALMAYYILKDNKNILIKLIGIIPFIGATFLNLFKNVTDALLPKLSELMSIYSKNELIINSFDIKNVTLLIPILIYLVILACILINIFLIFKEEKNTQISLIIIYLLGLMTRFIMGFSPTVFASGERTTLFLYYSFIIIGIMIYKKIMDKYDKAENIQVICSSLSILNLINGL